MAGFARQAVILSLSRIANYGLMIISPVILVRVLTVGDFGRYREFLLYASLLQSIASFSISDSLLYFIPARPASSWRIVRQTAILTAAVSICIVLGFYILDLVTSGSLAGRYRLPVALYVLLFVNVDFWESFWLATHQTVRVFIYSAARLIARMLVVVSVAVATNNVMTIIWSLIVLEAVRFIVFAAVWISLDRARNEPPIENIRRDQLRFCVPVGLATVLFLISRNLANVFVAKWLGAAALAQMTIGTYGEPIILALRNSISTVMLPELVRRGVQSPDAPLQLWRRTTIINCVLLFPAAVLLAWFAQPLVLNVFGPKYGPAVPVLQVYGLVIVIACFDFSPPLRAINQTRPLVTSNLVAAIASGLVLVFLLPLAGLIGAALTLVVSGLVEATYNAWCVGRLYGIPQRNLVPWRGTASVALCAAGAALPVVAFTWSLQMGIPGIMFASVIYFALFVALLMATRVEEAITLVQRIGKALGVKAFGGSQ
jgi:O-antigen/teichoic acid export membrane protein